MFDGGEFRERRRSRGLTQAEIARRSGVPQPNVSAIETGRVQPEAATVERLERALRRRPSEALAEHRDKLIALGERLGVTQLRVFGSVLRGEDTVDSDLDLVGTLAQGLDAFDLAAFELAAESLLGVPIEVLTAGSTGRIAERIRAEAQPL